VVTDDEAFIRRVVDSPGDDLPRLVYADWLDERGDPRGSYLRAEIQWSNAISKDATRQPAALASAFDKLWVLRVSRPPIGVCSNHFTTPAIEPHLTDIDLTNAETILQASIPLSFRAFLLNFNGRHPQIDCIKFSGDDPTHPTGINLFLNYIPEPVKPGDADGDGDILGVNVYAQREYCLPTTFLAFAWMSSTIGEMLLLSTHSADLGSVYAISEWHTKFDINSVTMVSQSLPHLLSRLRPYWIS
jgi:uncharacterized protein (TIGR02996 family)